MSVLPSCALSIKIRKTLLMVYPLEEQTKNKIKACRFSHHFGYWASFKDVACDMFH